MKIFVKIFIALVVFTSLSSCLFTGINGNGKVIAKSRIISDDFIRVKADSGINVVITESDQTSLVVEADENLHEWIITKVENGTLYIGVNKDIWTYSSKRVHLAIEELNAIEVSDGAEVISRNTLHTDNLTLIARSGAELNLHVNINKLKCKTSGGADVNLDGTANNFNVITSGGGRINAYGLQSEHCDVEATGGSDIKVYAEKSIRASASKGAFIGFKGNPKIINTNKNSSGIIKKS